MEPIPEFQMTAELARNRRRLAWASEHLRIPRNQPATRPPIAVIGGAGHVGLPLALTFANEGHPTLIYDIDGPKIERILAGHMPFREEGGQEALSQALASGLLRASVSPEGLRDCEFLVLVVGTPVDEHLNPTFNAIHRALEGCLPYLVDGQILILRSTVFPGISAHIRRFLAERGLQIEVAFCPERVAQGFSLREFRELPQIISAFDEQILSRVRRLFEGFSAEILELPPMEAELAKLVTNAWRYLQFAAVNQFYMIAAQSGLDFQRILHACRHRYPRMAGMPGPGLAAGPCLVKDTMQLAAFSQNSFALGHGAMLINEGLPAFLIEQAARQTDLGDKTVGILGMAFKAGSDDPRDSLSYKMRKLLTLRAARVLCTDPYIQDGRTVSIQQVLEECQVLFVGTPHPEYRSLRPRPGTVVVDVWNCLGETQEIGPSATADEKDGPE